MSFDVNMTVTEQHIKQSGELLLLNTDHHQMSNYTNSSEKLALTQM